MKRLYSFIAMMALVLGIASAQIVTTSPLIVQENSKDVVLTYHAASPLGNMGLANLPSTTSVYAHIGVITSKSANRSDWKYAPTWGDNAEKYHMTYVSPNTYTLNIGNMRTYFGITDPSEVIEEIALVFRTGDKSKEGKTAAGGDIFVDVYGSGFQMLLQSDAPGTVVGSPTTINLTAATTEKATITIAVNGNTLASKSGVTELKASYNIAATGSYTFSATATNNAGQSISQKKTVAYPGASTPGTYPGGVPKMGAVKNNDGSVTFCLAAPNKNSVVLVPSWDDYEVLDKNIMKYQDYNGQRYFFTTVSGLADDRWYPYYYIVDATVKCADPYANLVLDCYSDKWLDPSVWPDMPKYPYDKFDDVMLAVYRGDLNGSYKFSDFTIPDHKNLVVYELLLRDFTGTDGQADGNGTVRKAIEKIPYLKSLGVNAVEIMPIMQFSGNNSWGYNTNFYMAPDKCYGSPWDYMELVETCHLNGIAVILDIALNHADGLNPWYQMYPAGQNPFFNATAPHDYSVFNDWNQSNPLVQQQFHDAIQYWMRNYNVDGYRFDLVKGLGTDYPSGTEAYNPTRVATMRRLQKAIAEVKADGIHINENLATAQEENEMFADGGQMNWANINYNSCQYAKGSSRANGLNRFLATTDGNRSAWSTVSYAESHDEQRMGYEQVAYGETSAIKSDKALRYNRLGQVAVQMLATPGAKMIWQFGELGDSQNTKNSDGGNNTDPKIVPWGTLSDPAVEHLHGVYAAMCQLRKKNNDLFTLGEYYQSGLNQNSLTTNRIQIIKYGDQQVLAVVNPAVQGSAKRVTIASSRADKLLPTNCQIITYSSNFSSTPVLSKSGSNLTVNVPANGFVVFATKEVSDVDQTIADGIGENTLNVYGAEGRIVIDGEYDNATVYSISGMVQGSLNVPAGIYIVNVDGRTFKVAVR